MRIEIDQVPTYRVKTGKSFYDCPSGTYVGSEEEVEWEGVPNDNFEPMNEAAVIEMDKFYQFVDSLPRPKNPSAQGQDIGQSIISALKELTAANRAPQPVMDVTSAAEELGVDPKVLMKALGITALPGQVGSAPVIPHDFEVPKTRRRAKLGSAEPEEVSLDTRARVEQPTRIRKMEPRAPNPRGRPRKIVPQNAFAAGIAEAG